MKVLYKNKKVEIIIIAINLLTAATVIAALVMLYGFDQPPYSVTSLHYIQIAAFLIFATEKAVRFVNAASKPLFLRANWIEMPLLIALALVLFAAETLFPQKNPGYIKMLGLDIYLLTQVMLKLIKACSNFATNKHNPLHQTRKTSIGMMSSKSKHDNIYVSDLDGTLLRNDESISDYTRKNLTNLLNCGLNFTVASARSIVSVKRILRRIPLKLPIININGAFISDFNSGRHLIINDMDRPLIEDVYRRIIKHNCTPFVVSFDGKSDRLYYRNIANQGMQFYYDDRIIHNDKRLRHTKDLTKSFRDNVVAFTVISSHEHLKSLAEELTAELDQSLETHFFENPYSPPWWWLTIHDKAACKAIAIKTLVEMTGFSLDRLTVFGDNLNDKNMFKMARTAVAVKNATDNIKKYATEIIGSNEEDSVVKYLMEKTKKN